MADDDLRLKSASLIPPPGSFGSATPGINPDVQATLDRQKQRADYQALAAKLPNPPPMPAGLAGPAPLSSPSAPTKIPGAGFQVPDFSHRASTPNPLGFLDGASPPQSPLTEYGPPQTPLPAGMRQSSALPDTDIFRQTNSNTTQYAPLGAQAMGGGLGSATFQGKPTAGGFLGYVGTGETKDMNQADATAYNVARLNSQTDALRSLREARNPGITTGTGAFAPAAPAPIDPFSRPTDGNGDAEKRYQEYQGLLREAGTGRGLTAHQRQAMVQSAQWLIMPGIENAKLAQEGQQSANSLAAQQMQTQTASADRRFGENLTSQDRRYATDATLAGHQLTAQQQARQNALEQQKMALNQGQTAAELGLKQDDFALRAWQAGQGPQAVKTAQEAMDAQQAAALRQKIMAMPPGKERDDAATLYAQLSGGKFNPYAMFTAPAAQ